jgi:hypothetical protein
MGQLLARMSDNVRMTKIRPTPKKFDKLRATLMDPSRRLSKDDLKEIAAAARATKTWNTVEAVATLFVEKTKQHMTSDGAASYYQEHLVQKEEYPSVHDTEQMLDSEAAGD